MKMELVWVMMICLGMKMQRRSLRESRVAPGL